MQMLSFVHGKFIFVIDDSIARHFSRKRRCKVPAIGTKWSKNLQSTLQRPNMCPRNALESLVTIASFLFSDTLCGVSSSCAPTRELAFSFY